MPEQSVLIIQCIGPDGNYILDWIPGNENYCDVPGWLLAGLGIRGYKNGEAFQLEIGQSTITFRKVHSRLDYTRIQWLG